jgi:hypothetical protein
MTVRPFHVRSAAVVPDDGCIAFEARFNRRATVEQREEMQDRESLLERKRRVDGGRSVECGCMREDCTAPAIDAKVPGRTKTGCVSRRNSKVATLPTLTLLSITQQCSVLPRSDNVEAAKVLQPAIMSATERTFRKFGQNYEPSVRRTHSFDAVKQL